MCVWGKAVPVLSEYLISFTRLVLYLVSPPSLFVSPSLSPLLLYLSLSPTPYFLIPPVSFLSFLPPSPLCTVLPSGGKRITLPFHGHSSLTETMTSPSGTVYPFTKKNTSHNYLIN